MRLDGSFWRNQYGLNVDRMRVRWLEKQEAVDLFAGTPERRAALERDWPTSLLWSRRSSDPRLRLLCQTYLQEYGEKFRRAAAARDYHHARRGGLLEHTAQMMRAGAALGPVYPGLNWDLVRAGLLFHDCGKLWEMDYQPQGFVSPMTTIGELLGHITIGIELVNKLWRGLESNPEFSAVPPSRRAKWCANIFCISSPRITAKKNMARRSRPARPRRGCSITSTTSTRIWKCLRRPTPRRRRSRRAFTIIAVRSKAGPSLRWRSGFPRKSLMQRRRSKGRNRRIEKSTFAPHTRAGGLPRYFFSNFFITA